jgi:hypothetical protein
MSSFAPAARFAATALAVLIAAAATLGSAALLQNSLGDKLDPSALTPFASSVDQPNGLVVETATPTERLS